MAETEIEKRLRNLGVPPASEGAKKKTSNEAFIRLRKRQSFRHSGLARVASVLLVVGISSGLLSFAVTQSTRSGGGDASGETSLIGGSQITKYPASMRTSLVRMVIGGQKAELLEFNAPSEFANCTIDEHGNASRCVFHPTGGGATYIAAPAEIMADGQAGMWAFNGDNEIHLVGSSTGNDNSSSATADIIAFLEGISYSACNKINEELRIGPPVPIENGIVINSDSMINHNGKTNSSITGAGKTIGFDVPELDGQAFGCFQSRETKNYVYYHVLIER